MFLPFAFLLVGPLALSAESTPPETSGAVERGDGPIGFIYWSDGYLAIAGDAFDFCVNPAPPSGPGGMAVTPDNGSTITFSRSEVPVSVYAYPGPGGPDDPSGGFEFLGANCGAIFDGDSSTAPIEPVATGTVRLRSKMHTNPDGITDSRNSLVGSVTTSSGETAKLHTSAHVIFTDGGATLIDLDDLTVRYSG